LEGATELHRKSLVEFEKLGNLKGVATQWVNLGVIHLNRKEFDKAEETLQKAVTIFQEIGCSCHRSLQNQPRKVELNQPPTLHRRNELFHSKKLLSRALREIFGMKK
jgi:tetratricopeptide (TPR) repeat protein